MEKSSVRERLFPIKHHILSRGVFRRLFPAWVNKLLCGFHDRVYEFHDPFTDFMIVFMNFMIRSRIS